MIEAILEKIASISGAGWLVAALFGYAYWLERKARDKQYEKQLAEKDASNGILVKLTKDTLDTINNNNNILNLITQKLK